MAKKKAIVAKQGPKSSLLKFHENVTEDIITVPSCKFCNLKFRSDAEAEYDRTKNCHQVARFIAHRGEEVSRVAVRNHIINHYLPTIDKVKLECYSSNLVEYLQEEQDHRMQLRERIWMFSKLMYDIAADSVGCDIEIRMKTADSLKKLSDSISTMENKISEIDNSLEPAQAVIKNVSDILSEEMRKTDNEDVKRALMGVLEKLIERTNDLFVEEKD